MRQQTRQPNAFHRVTALCVALLCLWMATGGVLHHVHANRLAPPTGMGLGHVLPAATVVASCAACEWTEGVQSGSLTVCRLAAPVVFARSRSIAAVVRPRPRLIRLFSLRAPPAFPVAFG